MVATSAKPVQRLYRVQARHGLQSVSILGGVMLIADTPLKLGEKFSQFRGFRLEALTQQEKQTTHKDTRTPPSSQLFMRAAFNNAVGTGIALLCQSTSLQRQPCEN
eukprot:6318611-Amphidinium_carterae.1